MLNIVNRWLAENSPPEALKKYNPKEWYKQTKSGEYKKALEEKWELEQLHNEFCRTSGLFLSEARLQREVHRVCSAAGIEVAREVKAGPSQRRCDLVVAAGGKTFAIECKLSGCAGSLDAAIGQVLCMAKLTGHLPILLIPSDTTVDDISKAVADDLGIPVLNELNVVQYVLGQGVTGSNQDRLTA